jgi:hypothetical protein
VTQKKKPQRGKKGASGARGGQRRGNLHDRAALDREIDHLAMRGPKSVWQESSEPAAGDPPTREELAGIDLLGRNSVRGGAIEGVSEASAESGLDHPPEDVVQEHIVRKNPPLVKDDTGPGGISMSGGAAGGARGNAGTSDMGAGTPEGYEEAGPGEQKATSRFDYEHGTLDTPE